LWDELANYQTIQTCTCGAAKDINKHIEEERIHEFLMGLDSNLYGTVQSNILALELLPNLNKVYAFVTREERQQSLAKGMESRELVEGAAFKASASTNRPPWNNNQSKNLGKCSYCQKLGHEKN